MYTASDSGMYQIPIADFGRRLQNNFGLRVVEHPEFGGVGNMHAPNSYHHYGEAIDIQDHRGGEGFGAEGFDGVGFVERTKNLRDRLRGAGAEVIGPGDMKGHETHLHLAGKGGMLNLNQQQYDYFYGGKAGGKMSTFAGSPPVMPATSVATETKPVAPTESGLDPKLSVTNVTPESDAAAQNLAKSYVDMTKSELDSAYDQMRASDPAKARTEGMKMHKAFFNKM